MNGTHKNSQMKQRRKTDAKSHTTWIPQIRAASLINSCQTVQCSAEMFFHSFPLLSELQTIQTQTKTPFTNDLQLH